MKREIIASITLLVVDLIWLSLFMKPRYSKMIQSIQGSPMVAKLLPAVLSYCCLVIGLIYFVLPNFKDKPFSVKNCLRYAFLFGIVVYGVYDFTAAAVLDKWNMPLAIIDTIWGGVLYFISCYILNFI